jgi:hypothetical protein
MAETLDDRSASTVCRQGKIVWDEVGFAWLWRRRARRRALFFSTEGAIPFWSLASSFWLLGFILPVNRLLFFPLSAKGWIAAHPAVFFVLSRFLLVSFHPARIDDAGAPAREDPRSAKLGEQSRSLCLADPRQTGELSRLDCATVHK